MSIIASRLTGVAPLAVHFESECTSEQFHTSRYIWNFDDATAGTWGTDGKSKNRAIGAMAAHVYETPGTYDVVVSIRTSAGISTQQTVQIEVTDPEVVYAGTLTTCVNPAGDADFTDAPIGCVQVSTDDISTVSSTATAGRRILFKRGCAWTTGCLTNWPQYSNGCTLGAYGTGTDIDKYGIYSNPPQITVLATGVDTESFFPTDRKQDWRIMDIDFLDPPRTCPSMTGGLWDFKQILYLHLRITGFKVTIGWGHFTGTGMQISEMGIVSCDISDGEDYVAYLGSEKIMLLGNSFQKSHVSHVVRCWQAYKGVIQNNLMASSSLDSSTGRLAMKLHGPNEPQIASTGGDHLSSRTEWLIVSDNIFGKGGPWPVGIGPQDPTKDERISNLIFERNLYCADIGIDSVLSPDLSKAYSFCGRQMTIRNNVVDAANYGNVILGIEIGLPGVGLMPMDIWIYNNTIYKPNQSPGNNWTGISIGTGVLTTVVRNNIISFPYAYNGTHVMISDGGIDTVKSNNILNGTLSFVDAQNVDPFKRNYELEEGSTSAIRQGYLLPSVFEDLNAISRIGTEYDIGAVKYGGVPMGDYAVTYTNTLADSGEPPVDELTYDSGDTVNVLGNGTLTRTGFTQDGWITVEA